MFHSILPFLCLPPIPIAECFIIMVGQKCQLVLELLNFIYFMCVCARTCVWSCVCRCEGNVCTTVRMSRWEDNSQDLVLSFHHVGSKSELRSLGLGTLLLSTERSQQSHCLYFHCSLSLLSLWSSWSSSSFPLPTSLSLKIILFSLSVFSSLCYLKKKAE